MWPLVIALVRAGWSSQRLDLVIMGVFSNLNNPTMNQGLGLNSRGEGTGRQNITRWMCYLVALPAGAVLPPWLVWPQCRARGTGAQQPLLQMFFPCMGAENIPREQLPLVPSAQPGTAPASPSIRWCQKNLQSYRETNPKSLFAKAGTSGTAGSCSLSETPGASRNRSHKDQWHRDGVQVLVWPSTEAFFTACKKHPLPR